MFGYDSREVLGKSIHTLIPAQDQNMVLSAFLEQINTAQSPIKSKEMVAKKKDGSTFSVHLSLSEGHISGRTFCAAFIRDITELKTFEQALVREKENTDKILVSLLPRLHFFFLHFSLE